MLAFRTGGLKDTVVELNPATGKGSGFTFESHTHSDFMQAVHVRRGCSARRRLAARAFAHARRAAAGHQRVQQPCAVQETPRQRRGGSHGPHHRRVGMVRGAGGTRLGVWGRSRGRCWCRYRELHRLRRVPVPPRRTTFKFLPTSSDPEPLRTGHADVRLVGSFTAWEGGIPLQWSTEAACYQVAVCLRRGTHAYKYVVDGKWTLSPGEEVVAGPNGMENHEMVVDEE